MANIAPGLSSLRQASAMATASKLALVVAGLTLLSAVSDGPQAAIVLIVVSLLSFALGRILCSVAHVSRLHIFIGRAAVPAALLALVLLNVTGLVGTLTGSQSTAASEASHALIAMPFYLLSAAAFLAEVSARKMSLPNPLDFLVYMTLPFKLLAGPLETPRLLQQIQNWRLRWRPNRMLSAWPWIAMGAFMKYVIANRLDPARHLVHTDPLTSLVTAGIFELKFYFDFAGYSFMAYGGALALGLHISQNFDQPFLAPNVVQFWRRWHMSLGRFLSRYVLEPNLSLWTGRTQKLLFASAIFMVSAMWHGGTLNYLFWGLFHGACYFAYGQWLRRRNIPAWVGVSAMLLFFVLGRMLAIDADSGRLLSRLGQFVTPQAWSTGLAASEAASYLAPDEGRALMAAALFLALEFVSSRLYPKRHGYHFFRKPWAAMSLAALFALFGQDGGTLLYARI